MREITMKLSGGCNCGQVRYELDGEPIRVGICHCETCRKESGSAFSFFGIWPKASATLSGELGCWQSRAGGERFCPKCGSSLFSWNDESDQIEIKLGTLDSPPSALVPAYELWTIRREPWLAHQKGAEQHARDRQDSGA
ncbi:GFA family protein [Chelatococcus albus]